MSAGASRLGRGSNLRVLQVGYRRRLRVTNVACLVLSAKTWYGIMCITAHESSPKLKSLTVQKRCEYTPSESRAANRTAKLHYFHVSRKISDLLGSWR